MNASNATLSLILTSVGLNAAAQIFLRVGVRQGFATQGRAITDIVVDVLMRPSVLAGLACYGLSVIIWLYVLSRAQASFAYPFLGLGFVLVALAGWLFLGEAPTPRRLAATALIVSGVVLLARG